MQAMKLKKLAAKPEVAAAKKPAAKKPAAKKPAAQKVAWLFAKTPAAKKAGAFIMRIKYNWIDNAIAINRLGP